MKTGRAHTIVKKTILLLAEKDIPILNKIKIMEDVCMKIGNTYNNKTSGFLFFFTISKYTAKIIREKAVIFRIFEMILTKGSMHICTSL